MATLWTLTLIVLFLIAGELLCTSGLETPSPNTAVLRAYTREALLALRWKGISPPVNLPVAVSTSGPAAAGRRRKRGRKGGVRQRIRRRGNRPPLPSIILSNVRSLRSKMDELRLLMRFSHEYREASLLVFTETCKVKTGAVSTPSEKSSVTLT
ncbi:hypothetical protein N1851_023109 [Merluccius polli]|uniref:Uncharacterized protein n=1 Tax=Merluccius polli TaxID=89951 RepID=A0AA47MGL3_MERPO|nr:hypothetical protein N1851_023109 [Merluccius polli]